MNKLFSTPLARMALVVLLAAVVVLIFRDSFASMVALWSLSSYQHAYLVPPVSLLLFWMARREFAAESLRGSGLGLALLAVLAVMWLGARASAVQAIEHITIVGMIIALVLAVLGWPAFRTIAFPIFLLLAAVPVGEELTPLLVSVTADLSEYLLRLLGVPVLREGMFFTLPGGNFEVADICSGLRYLMVGAVTALLFGYLNFNTWGKRIAFTLLAAVSFVVANGVRAFITMLVASATNGRLLGGEDHIYFGMVLFTVLLVTLLWFGMKLADPAPPRREYAPADPSRYRPAHVAGYLAVAIALMVSAAGLQASHVASGSTLLATRSPALDGCSGPGEWAAPWRPELVGADVETLATYHCGELLLHVYLASYGHQQQGKELISAQNHIVPFDWRQYTRRSNVTLDFASGSTGKPERDPRRDERPQRARLALVRRQRQALAHARADQAQRGARGAGPGRRRLLRAHGGGELGRDDFDAMRSLLESQVRTLWPVLAEEPRRSDRE